MTLRSFLKDTKTHIKYVKRVGESLVLFLLACNRQNEAIELSERLRTHDSSKFTQQEIDSFLMLKPEIKYKDSKCTPLTQNAKNAIMLHWTNNRHHPEHFVDYHEMTDVDIMEMVSDWYARSLQFKNDFYAFVNTARENRFHFDDEFFAKVNKYCEIVSGMPNPLYN